MAKVKSSLNDLLVNVFNYIISIEEIILKNRGLAISLNEMHILEAINKSDEATMKNIANILLITPGTLTVAVKRLIKKGYIKSSPGENDRRKKYLSLTNKAHEVMILHDEFHREMIDRVISKMDITEDSSLFVALENLQNYFKDIYYDEIGYRNEK